MHVGLNLIFLVPGETGGMEVAALELIAALVADAPADLQLTLFVNQEAADAGGPWSDGSLPSVVVPIKATNRVEWVRGEQQLLPGLAARAGCDLVHSLASTAPLRGAFRRLTTIHDLNYAMVPDTHFGLRGLGMRALVPAAARRSHRILVDAASTVEDLVQVLGTPREKIDVVPLGVRPPDASVTPTTPLELRTGLGLGGRRVLLSASAKRPHKNLLRLLDAHASLPADTRPVLVLPGYSTPHEADLVARAAALGTTDDVRLPAWVSAADLEGLYALADAFVFPSLHEGFGLPVLEAMARGVPVVCSDRSSLPEVAGDAALLVDPEDVGALASALTHLLDDGALRERLSAAGVERAAQFTWSRTADLTVQAYRRTLTA
ncbi:glycosyltransferase [Paraconexibacter sp. AEG42_29]|uniref:Glycosyltransferase n=1 Tax=Paraconexibacter sp. AEG42_29 TaxID=2997339 RepID=A0AAU7B2Z4_9ACTN